MTKKSTDISKLTEFIAKKIKAIRIIKGLTLQELAENINYSTRQLARIENAQTPITADFLYAICTFFDISPKSLMPETLKNLDTQFDTELEKMVDSTLSEPEKKEIEEFNKLLEDLKTLDVKKLVALTGILKRIL